MKIKNTKQMESLLQEEAYRLSELNSLAKVLRHSIDSNYLQEKVDDHDIANTMRVIERLADKSFHQVMDLSEEVALKEFKEERNLRISQSKEASQNSVNSYGYR